ncbi:hypothetical protein EDB86DRAFT_2870099, partial [Lactarius hatsudake]
MSSSSSTLTRVQFEQACKAFIDKHARSPPPSVGATTLKGWSWAEHPTVPGLGYLFRTVPLHGCALAPDEDVDFVQEDVPQSAVFVDDPAIADGASPEYFTCEQSIAFSPTFQVPAFYFTIHDSRGSPFGLEEIMNTSLLCHHALPETQTTSFALFQRDALFPLLSQGDHPTSGLPSWFIHPCGTACAMSELIGEKMAGGMPEVCSKEWLLVWLETWFLMLGNMVQL